jgi:hypothetical protein
MSVHVADATDVTRADKPEPTPLARLIRRELKSAAIAYARAFLAFALAAIVYWLLIY